MELMNIENKRWETIAEGVSLIPVGERMLVERLHLFMYLGGPCPDSCKPAILLITAGI